PPMQFLSFSGDQDEDVTAFLQNVNRIAFTEGRFRDNDWIADYVGACLTGVALDWYARLDEDIERNWRELRIALLQRFMARGDASLAPEPPTATGPLSTTAAPPPLAAPGPPPDRKFQSIAKTGR
ncbi:hypothetical protein FRB98_009282, partial [Tulasnella sp. 332]